MCSASSSPYASDLKHLSLLPTHSSAYYSSNYNPFSPTQNSPPSSPTGGTTLRPHPTNTNTNSYTYTTPPASPSPKRKPYGATHGRKWSTGKELVREMEELLEEQEEEEARGLVCKGGRWAGVEKVDWGVKGVQSGTVSPRRRESGMDPRGI